MLKMLAGRIIYIFFYELRNIFRAQDKFNFVYVCISSIKLITVRQKESAPALQTD